MSISAIKRVPLLLCALSLCPIVFADSGDDSSSATPGSQLQQIVVTATRTAQPLDKTGDSVSVISSADLTERQTPIISDALALLPGVTVARTGGPGQDTSLYIRGADPGQSLVLIDGIRINDPSTPDGEPVLGDLLVNNIDRIEVLRDPQSILYGSNAIGGVVNILTQRGGQSPFAGTLSGEGGTYGTWRANAAAHGSAGPADYGAALNYYDTRGIQVAQNSPVDTEPDSYHNLSASANVRVHANDILSVDLRALYIRSSTDIADYLPPDYLQLEASNEFILDSLRAGYAALNASLLDGALTQRLAVIGSDSDRRDYGQYTPLASNPAIESFAPLENFYAQGGSTRFEYQGVWDANSANELTYGAESELTTLATDSLPDPYDEATRGRDRVSGAYAQYQSTLAQQLTLTAGVRYDHDDQFGGHGSFKLNGAWQLFDGDTIVHANIANGFKAPSLYQQFSQYSNPLQTLAPETATGWEFGADQLLWQQRARASLSYFSRSARNEIDFNDCFVASSACALRPFGYYYNIDRSRSRGYEAQLTGQLLPRLSAFGNYTNLRAIDELTGLQLARRPHVSANAGLSWRSTDESSTVGASVSYLGARYDDAGNSVPLPSSRLFNLFASYALSAQLSLTARADNLFNCRSEPVAGYRPLGQAFYAGLRLTL